MQLFLVVLNFDYSLKIYSPLPSFLVIFAAIKAYNGEPDRYPFTIKILQ
ncbi:DUF4870 domain-containing protein [Nostoc sp.]